MIDLPLLKLKKDEERRLRAGHLWVFSNEVDNQATPLTGFTAGEAVVIADGRGRPLGTGYVNPHALICARLISRRRRHPFDPALLAQRIKQAQTLREALFERPFYRLIFGESDGLPGLVVDRYGDCLVVQLSTAGMDGAREALLEALKDGFKPKGILLRNDSPVRALEGLPLAVEIAWGEVPDTLLVPEGDGAFEVSLTQGQKTGWYFDQRDNRAFLRRLVAGRRVLDMFSYVGAWGIQAARAGAREVLCVDQSESALAAVKANAARNEVSDRVATLRGDAFEVLTNLKAVGERFEIIVLDPPAFIRRRKDLEEGIAAYRRLNEAALRLLPPDGILVSCSCSSHLACEELTRQVLRATRESGQTMQIIKYGQQGADHPVHPAIPETSYLKALFTRITH